MTSTAGAPAPVPEGSTPAGGDDWDGHWDSFGDPANGNPANAYRHHLVLQQLGRPAAGSTIVDIGSGQGELALLLAETFPDVSVCGLEFSAEGVRRSRRAADANGVRVTFEQRDLLQPQAGALGHAPGSLAVCSEVLEHVDEPALLLRNAASHLAPGCRVVITVPGGPRSAFDRHIGHRQHFTAVSLRGVVEAAGLRVEAIHRTGWPFFNLYRMLVILRGRKLVEDLENPAPSAAAGTASLLLRTFGLLFKANLTSSPFGWQMMAIASVPAAETP